MAESSKTRASNGSETVVGQAQGYLEKGIAYVQDSTFGSGQTEGSAGHGQASVAGSGEASQKQTDPAFGAHVDKAHDGSIEDFMRQQTRTQAAPDVMKDKQQDQ